MDGIHDLGGVEGFGPIEVERDEPVFHADWERRVFGMAALVTGGGLANVHAFRHAIERMDPVHYLESSYYEHWLTAAASLLVERGVVTRAELDTRTGAPFTLARPARDPRPADATPRAPAAAAPAARPRFAPGDAVIVRNIHPHGHTRCPRYVRGRRGTIVRADDAFPLPDLAAHGRAPRVFTYGVRFDARELWGAEGGAGEAVQVDLWETYLEPAP
jgi:nitrile hydratase beta subunit